MRVALLQLNASDDPAANLPETLALMDEAVLSGADIIMTPEVTNCVSGNRDRQNEVLTDEANDQTLYSMRTQAAAFKTWVLIGSLALKGGSDGRFVNRSFLIDPTGRVVARYDKIHMFDVVLSEQEKYRESAGYAPGETAVTHAVGDAVLGMTVCYDLRFPHLYRRLAHAGATVLTVPSAFATITGEAHWEPLLRARAIENGAFVIAPAQCGTHAANAGIRPRQTYGHSLVIDPWGEILADGGEMPGVITVDLDLSKIDTCRGRIPSLTHDRPFEGP